MYEGYFGFHSNVSSRNK
ncbi:hypothetical protein LOR24_02310 [Staphylococcus aureus]